MQKIKENIRNRDCREDSIIYLTTDDIKNTEADILEVSNFSIFLTRKKICSIRRKNYSLGSTL